MKQFDAARPTSATSGTPSIRGPQSGVPVTNPLPPSPLTITAGSGRKSYSTNIPAHCAVTGGGWSGQEVSWSKSWDPGPKSIQCAGLLLDEIKKQAKNRTNGANIAVALSERLLDGRTDLRDPYEVFLDNLERSMHAMGKLTSKEIDECELGLKLMIVCKGGGVWSQGGGTAWGNVFIINDQSSRTISGAKSDQNLMTHEQVHA